MISEQQWLDSWMAKRLSRRIRERLGLPRASWAESTHGRKPRPLRAYTLADTMYILRHGKKAWRAMKEAEPVT